MSELKSDLEVFFDSMHRIDQDDLFALAVEKYKRFGWTVNNESPVTFDATGTPIGPSLQLCFILPVCFGLLGLILAIAILHSQFKPQTLTLTALPDNTLHIHGDKRSRIVTTERKLYPNKSYTYREVVLTIVVLSLLSSCLWLMALK